MSDLRRELVRKLVHLSGLIYIPAYLYFGRELVVWGIVLILLVSAVFEYFRIKYGLLSGIVRKYEKREIGAYIYFGIAVLLVTLIFPMDACFVAVSVSLVGDGLAGIVKRLGFRYAASGVMVVAPLLFIVALSLATFTPSLMACIAGAAIERVERIGGYYLQDNLSVPVVAATIYEITKYIIT